MDADLFLDCIFLLVNDSSQRYQKLVGELVSNYEEEAKVKEGSDAELIRYYISIINELIRGKINRDDPDSLTRLMIKLKTNKALDRYSYVADSLMKAFSSRSIIGPDGKEKSQAEQAAMADAVTDTVTRIKATVITRRIDRANRKIFSKIQALSGIDPEHQLDSLITIKEELEKAKQVIELDDSVNTYTGVVPTGMIVFHDRPTIKAALQKRNARDCKGVIKSGLQGLNRALGEAEGLIPGESICHAALSYHYKSGMIVSWALWAVEYNPQTTTDEGIPLVLLISLENEEYRNMMDIFKKTYLQVEGKEAKGMGDEDIENWIIDYFAKFDTKFVIERYADGFGFSEYRSRLAYWKSLGYKIVLTALDYLSNMKLTDDQNASKGSRDSGLRTLSYNLVNDARIGGYSFVTGHQLNRMAETIAESNPVPVKKFTLNTLQDSSSIHREFDIMCYQYCEVIPSSQVKYLECYIPKHRHVNDTPESHKFFAYPFKPKIGIKDDVGGPPGFVMDPYTADFASDEAFDQAVNGSVNTPAMADAF